MPTVTAIITTFNRAGYLKKAIESVLAQTCEDFELLILDNSSVDNTAEVVSSFRDHRLRYIKHEPLNISRTRNLGVREARGEYIAFLDDDDEWLPWKLDKELGLFKSMDDENVAFVYGGFVRVDTEGNEFYTHKPKLRGKVLRSILFLEDDFTGSASNPLIKKSAIEKLGGYDEEVATGEDWELYLRLAEKYKVDFVPEPVVRILHHFGARLGDKLADYVNLDMMVMDRFGYLIEADKGLHSFYLQRIGGKFIRLGEVGKGRKYLFQAMKLDPLNYIVYAQYLLSLLNQRAYSYFHRIYLNSKRTVRI